MDDTSGSEAPRSHRVSAVDSPEGALRSTERKVQGGFAFALACLALVAVASYLSVVHLRANAAWVQHTDEVLRRLDSLLAAATDSETAERGYVITGDDSYLEPYRRSADVVDVE
ncbi:MAG TPA: CHASE3 domain-containing protein, partial [Steroidobacteraceae bacterium]